MHVAEESAWLPQLRTLSLRDNTINATVHDTLQSVIGWSTLQTLDLRNNLLSGTLDGSLDMYYCEDEASGACGAVGVRSGGSSLATLLLSSNLISGELRETMLPSSLLVLTLSNNLLHGAVPDSFSQLRVFLASEKARVNRILEALAARGG